VIALIVLCILVVVVSSIAIYRDYLKRQESLQVFTTGTPQLESTLLTEDGASLSSETPLIITEAAVETLAAETQSSPEATADTPKPPEATGADPALSATQTANWRRTQAGYIPEIDGFPLRIRFYESGAKDLPPDERIFSARFPKKTTRRINFQLSLSHAAQIKRANFHMYVVYFGPQGKLGAFESDSYIEPGWTTSVHTGGFGWDQPGNWPKGKCLVEIYIGNQQVTSGVFEIY